MSTKTATLALDGDGIRLAGTVGSGHAVILDGDATDTGPRPAELIPLAVAGCTAMDVVSILRKKRQAFERYEVRARGEQADEWPHEFLRIDIVHVVDGPVEVEALRRAIELSATRYCSVGCTLASGVTAVHHSYVLRDGNGEETMAEVVVLGPHAELHPEPSATA